MAFPGTADATDAASLVALAAASTDLDVIHTATVERHLPTPGSTVPGGRQKRPGLVKAVNDPSAIVADLAGEVEVFLRSFSPDPLMAAEPCQARRHSRTGPVATMRTAQAGSRSAFAAVGAGRFRPQATVKTVGRNVGKSGNRPLFGWCVPLLRGARRG